jgi:hypothetical protein
MSSGEEKAWNILRNLKPAGVCRNAMVSFDDATGIYLLKSFGMDLSVAPENMSIYSEAPYADLLLNRLGYFSKLSIPVYLTSAMDIPPTGRLVQPVNVKGGNIFFRGTHVLPLDKLALKYGKDKEGFLKRGADLGGMQMKYGDASVKLFPFPRLPVVIILWQEDDEFPPRADILFDSTCEFHLALDILWSTAMECLLIMM